MPPRVHPERMHRVAAVAAALVGIAGEGVAIALAPTELGTLERARGRRRHRGVRRRRAADRLAPAWPPHRHDGRGDGLPCGARARRWSRTRRRCLRDDPAEGLAALAVRRRQHPARPAVAGPRALAAADLPRRRSPTTPGCGVRRPDSSPSPSPASRSSACSRPRSPTCASTPWTTRSACPTRCRRPRTVSPGSDLLLALVCLGLVVACLVQQYRRGGPLGRQQTLIFALAFIPPVFAFAASANDSAGPWLFGLSTLPVPIAIGVAVLQRRLYDLPLALNRSLTYGSLWLLIALLYAVTVGGVGALVRDEGAAWLPWVAAGVVAVSFAPLRDALQRAANRITYGQWASPDEVRARTSRRLAEAGELERRARLPGARPRGGPRARVRRDPRPRGRHARHRRATPPTSCDELPLTAYGAPVGSLRWTRRPLRETGPGTARRAGRTARRRRPRRRAGGLRAPGAGATRARPRGGAPPTAPRPARRARACPGRPQPPGRHRAQHHGRRARGGGRACSGCAPGSRRPCSTCAASSRGCGLRPSTTSAWSRPCGSWPDASAATRRVEAEDCPGCRPRSRSRRTASSRRR